jgi:hypothetical protein
MGRSPCRVSLSVTERTQQNLREGNHSEIVPLADKNGCIGRDTDQNGRDEAFQVKNAPSSDRWTHGTISSMDIDFLNVQATEPLSCHVKSPKIYITK